MNLEIIPKMQWYRRLLRRFNTVFTGQATLQNKLDAQSVEINRLCQEQHAATIEVIKNLQRDFSIFKEELHIIQNKQQNIEENLQDLQKIHRNVEHIQNNFASYRMVYINCINAHFRLK